MLPLTPASEIDLILYDLDGTLVDSAPDLLCAVNDMLVDMGHPQVNLKLLKTWVGNGSAVLVKRALANAQQVEESDLSDSVSEQGHTLFFKHYHSSNGRHSQLYGGVKETLMHFQQQGISQAIVTNKPEAFTGPLLEQLGLSHFFCQVISGDTLPLKKPDAAPLLHCLEAQQVKPKKCLMVGDSLTDIKAAQAANVPCVAVSGGYNRGVNLREIDLPLVAVVNQLTELFKPAA